MHCGGRIEDIIKTSEKHVAALSITAFVTLTCAGCALDQPLAGLGNILGTPVKAQATGSAQDNSLLIAAQRKVAAGADAKALREELSSVISGGCATGGFPDTDCLARAYAPGTVEDRLGAARFLLDNGASVNQARQDSPDVYWIKSEKPLPEAMRLLGGADSVDDSATAREVGKMAALLVSRGANVNDLVACLPELSNEDVCRDTPLALAARSGNIELVRLLLEKGAKVSQSGHYNDSSLGAPLNHAVQSGYVEIVKLLLEKGASVRTVDINNMTPLKVAQTSLEYAETEAQKNQYREIIKLLKGAGAGKSGKKNSRQEKTLTRPDFDIPRRLQ